MRWRGTCLVVLAGVLAGCQSLPSREVQTLTIFQDAQRRVTAENGYPLDVSVAVAPTLQAYETGFLPPDYSFKENQAEAFPEDEIDPENVYRVPVSKTETDLQGEVIKALSGLGMFDEVIDFTGGNQRQGVRLLKEAKEALHDYLVIPRVRANFVSYKGANDAWWWPGLIGWIFAWIPTYFVPDETFEAYLDIELEIYNVRLGSTIMAQNPELLGVGFEAELAEALEPAKVFGWAENDTQDADISDLDMGFVTSVPWSAVTVRFFGRSWGVLEAGNFVNVSELVTPPVLAKNLAEICKQLVDNFAIAVRDREDELQASAAKDRFAIIVGVGKYSDPAFEYYSKNDKQEQISFAAEDAQAMYDFLLKDCGFRKQDMALLINDAATRAEIIKQITKRKNSLRDDLLFIYFAGHSAIDAELADLLDEDGSIKDADLFSKYFLPYDAQADDLAGTALGIADQPEGLSDVLSGVGSEKVVLILDTAFGKHSYLRPGLFDALDLDDDGYLSQREEPTIRPSFLEGIANQGRDIVLAADFNEPVMQNTLTSHGEFCYQFAIAGPTRIDSKRLNLQELTEYAQDEIFRLSRFRNQPQQPRILRNERLPGINLNPEYSPDNN